MPNAELKKEHAAHGKEEPKLKGTFISVMIVGALLILSWVGVFGLFLAR
ncbi:cytochrome c oxidase subunit 2A [Thalassobacillus hwangdonensis]|uniref:Cytochrome c oxidase subunit 2A n=1 Tax=Thalassobacillus hwangdonensis TaxID=546108 RepID=A0ABW3KX38_9BACI